MVRISMLKELFESERQILNHFFDNINFEQVEILLDILRNCEGMIITTGVGKSGLVAEKIALTLTSTGSKAFFLSSSNALHGDIGIVGKNDVFIMISKSGESEELLQLIPTLRNRGTKLIAIVNKANSRLAKACDHSVVLPIEKELCPYDMVPTISSVTHMILGDILAIALMTLKNFSLLEYAQNHPAGKIGRRLTLRVSDLMLKGDDIPRADPHSKLLDILVELSNKRCGCVLVLDPSHVLQGIFTDGDLRRALQKYGPKALESSIQMLMTRNPRYISSEEMAYQALSVMEADQLHPVTALPVIDSNHRVVGLIKMHDIVQSGL